jgi:tetratricopeptide (TPR) repeat protein
MRVVAMLPLRTLTLSWTCALTLLACEAPPVQQPLPVTTPAPTTAAPPAPAADLGAAETHYVQALELESAGRLVEARAEVDLALAAGAGRDARLLAAKLAILRNDLDGASNLLAPLGNDQADALVQYNIGLVAQRRNEYNRARTAYLAAVKADPNYAPARFNLAILTWDNGVREEAQHHARKFLELSPGDPRAAELSAKVELTAGPAAPAAPGDPGAPGTLTAPGAPGQPDTKAGLADPLGKDTKKGASGLKNPFEGDKPAKAGDTGIKDPFAGRK